MYGFWILYNFSNLEMSSVISLLVPHWWFFCLFVFLVGWVWVPEFFCLFFNYSNHQKFSFEKMKLNGGICSTSSLKLNNLKLIVFLVSWLLLSITELFWNLKYPKVVVSSSMRPWHMIGSHRTSRFIQITFSESFIVLQLITEDLKYLTVSLGNEYVWDRAWHQTFIGRVFDT